MALKKTRTTKAPTDGPDWIFGRGVAEHDEEFQAALAQEQLKSSVLTIIRPNQRVYRPWTPSWSEHHFHMVWKT
ncbi:hypothetical protein Pyn_16613 [Prunus yedoensis var. nudiflora]|uniref:Uncharacterized protein n=1 Tax=Prunus yedoensis var. nudiflora TaxID=2094558 RepID=A0A314U697_PRUYE|nr:hypothetical protein Pyn_16613 [Prunus yedoensis var. nudiflora]